MGFEEELAGFYWTLFDALIYKGFNDDQAMKIILREAKIPRPSKGEKEVTLSEIIKELKKK